MPSQLEWTTDENQIVDSLKEFNSDAPRFNNQRLAWDLIRRTQYWVHDVPSDTFGPSKFVGFASMNYDLYQQARDGKVTGARFDGYQTRTAIERALKQPFRSDKDLHDSLVRWAEALVGPLVFENVSPTKWAFVDVRADEASADLTKSWSDWAPLADEHVRSVPQKPGGYQVRAVDEKRRPRTVRRCFGDDREGILSIGESGNLRKRVADLLRCMGDKEQSGHIAGWRYAYLEMGRIFPLGNLQFRYRITKDDASAYELEGALMQDYVSRHFELPPLNYKFNWSLWDKAQTGRA